MPNIPKSVAETSLSRKLKNAGLIRIHQGKVRDTYAVPDRSELLFVVATDRISIFDFVLAALVPEKGMVLTAMTIFWLTTVLKDVPNHLVTYGDGIDLFLPDSLKNDKELQARTIVVKRLRMIPIECIIRFFLTGTGLKAYQKNGQVCGHQLPAGLHDGSRLEKAIFTPTTKADIGHDEHVDVQSVADSFGPELEAMTHKVGDLLSKACKKAGIFLADSKFEFGTDHRNELVLGDEVCSPDSSRFWDEEDWANAQKKQKSPSGYDKQPVRDWGMTIKTTLTGPDGKNIVGLNNLKPENDQHVFFVNSLGVPGEKMVETSERYKAIFQRLTGKSLEEYQLKVMGIK